MGAANKTYLIWNLEEKDFVWFLFKTKSRKRPALLYNLLTKHVTFDNVQGKNWKSLKTRKDRPSLFLCGTLMEASFEKILEKYKNEKNYKIKGEESVYSGADIELLNDRNNWYEWQKKIYQIIFEDSDTIKQAHPREIIFIVDTLGNSGKSIFWKWLYLKNQRDIGFLSEGRASQIKANIFKLGPKKLYIIDLPRTPAAIGTAQFINSIEELKNGMVTRLGKVMMMSPPWVILTGRDISMSLWSLDRLVVYSINNDDKKDWTDISQERRKIA